jgi:aryl-alcohol dehydrogenase-like predicted oxidoreductase
MKYRTLGRTGYNVSEVSFGAWAIGGAWGTVDDSVSMAALNKAVDLGVNFIDTADVYGDGRSERLIAKLRKERKETITVATKAGRRLPKPDAAGYTRENLTAWIERSLKNLEAETLDLLQLHTPPTELFYMPEIFGYLDDFVKQGKIRYYGVSVEKVEQGLMALEYTNVQSVQIIFNAFRLRPSELFFEQAKKRQVGILARVPLASGLLTGKITRESSFATDDHRQFNRNGERFDKGETFSGVEFDTALDAVEEIRKLVPSGMSMTQFALKWISMFDAVTCSIPGARNPEQAAQNFTISELPALSPAQMQGVKRVYDAMIRPLVHHRW